MLPIPHYRVHYETQRFSTTKSSRLAKALDAMQNQPLTQATNRQRKPRASGSGTGTSNAPNPLASVVDKENQRPQQSQPDDADDNTNPMDLVSLQLWANHFADNAADAVNQLDLTSTSRAFSAASVVMKGNPRPQQSQPTEADDTITHAMKQMELTSSSQAFSAASALLQDEHHSISAPALSESVPSTTTPTLAGITAQSILVSSAQADQVINKLANGTLFVKDGVDTNHLFYTRAKKATHKQLPTFQHAPEDEDKMFVAMDDIREGIREMQNARIAQETEREFLRKQVATMQSELSTTKRENASLNLQVKDMNVMQAKLQQEQIRLQEEQAKVKKVKREKQEAAYARTRVHQMTREKWQQAEKALREIRSDRTEAEREMRECADAIEELKQSWKRQEKELRVKNKALAKALAEAKGEGDETLAAFKVKLYK